MTLLPILVSQRVNQQCERRVVLPTARIVKVVSGQFWTPVVEHGHQPAALYMLFNLIHREIAETKPLERSIHDQVNRIEDQLTLGPDLDLSPFFFQSPTHINRRR